MAKNWSDTPHEDAARTEYEKSMNQSYNDAQSFRALAAQLATILDAATEAIDHSVKISSSSPCAAEMHNALEAARKAGIL